MIRLAVIRNLLVALAAICATSDAAARPATTSGAIAVANLDYLLTQPGEPAARIELLLARSRFCADYDALDQAVALAETLALDGSGLLLRARARAAVHRFTDALDDLRLAARVGADPVEIDAQRAVIQIATGHAADALASLQSAVVVRPGYAAHSALAGAYAELGRFDEADQEYRRALAGLTTTSPFPYAWTHFALGLMWSEQAGDTRRGEAEYVQALHYLPQFAVATIHLAEIERDRGDLRSAQARLIPLVQAAAEPEALALLGEIRRQAGQAVQAEQDIALAERRYRALLARQPLAFVDHAAEFYLGAGANGAQARVLALRNLANRPTPRAYALARRASAANGENLGALAEWRRHAEPARPRREPVNTCGDP